MRDWRPSNAIATRSEFVRPLSYFPSLLAIVAPCLADFRRKTARIAGIRLQCGRFRNVVGYTTSHLTNQGIDVSDGHWQEVIQTVQAGRDLSQDTMMRAIEAMLLGQIASPSIAELLLALRQKGETVDELAGAAFAMRAVMTPIQSRHVHLLDTCGTGGDGSRTFNISTAAAIVSAAAGVPVAKHGNRKITSATGSADVLSELGIRIEAPRHVVERCIDQLGIGFCFAPLLHPALRQVAEVRRALGVPTLFNYLGPLCNPAGASHQILGVAKEGLHETMARVLARLPVRRAIVVRGEDGMDEVTLSGWTRVFLVQEGSICELKWHPEDFGLPRSDQRELLVDTPKESAEIIRAVLQGHRGASRDIVLANAAAGLWITGRFAKLEDAVACCAAAIDDQRAWTLLQQLSSMSQSDS